MNSPIHSKKTDRHEAHVFPLGTEQTQKIELLQLDDVHEQGGVIRDLSFGVQGISHTVGCAPVFLSHKGVTDGTNTVATPADVGLLMRSGLTGRNLFIAGAVLAGLALLLAVVTYFMPRLLGGLAKYSGYASVALLLVAVVLVALDRKDQF